MINSKDYRFQIYITYLCYKPMWVIEYEGLEGDENTLFIDRGYWNRYSTKEEAINKYKEKLNILMDDPCSYADLSCMDVKTARISLVDTEYNLVLAEKCFKL